jgi:hypothetical protein
MRKSCFGFKMDNRKTSFHSRLVRVYPFHRLLIPKRSPLRRPLDALSTMMVLRRARISLALRSFLSRSGTKLYTSFENVLQEL